MTWLRFPGGLLFGSMLGSAILHGTGWVHALLPWWLGSAAVIVLGAVAGIVPAGESDIKPELNSIQRLVAKNIDRSWRIVLYQNTPAQFHGRSEAAEKLTEELRNARRPG